MGKEDMPRPRGTWRWQALPDDLYVKIFCLLPAQEITSSCALVCRSWRHFSSNDNLWKELCKRAGLRDLRGLLASSRLKTWRSLFRALYGTNLIASPHFERIDHIDYNFLRNRRAQNCEPMFTLSPDRLFSEDENHDDYHNFCHWVPSGSASQVNSGGGDGMIRECPPVGCPPCPGAPGKPVLATSFDWGTVCQSVKLARFPRDFLDQSPPLLLSVWYAGRRGSVGLFRIEVGLRDVLNRVIFSR